MIGASELSHGQEQKADDMLLMLVSISYPISDRVLLVPAILILWSIRKGKLVITHWMLIALSMIFVGIADSGFGYMAISNINLVHEADWIWDILYNTGYCSSMYGITAFSYLTKKKEQKKWQERNR